MDQDENQLRPEQGNFDPPRFFLFARFGSDGPNVGLDSNRMEKY